MKSLEVLKPLLRFDCFFATLALILIFAFFFAVTFWVPTDSDTSKIILGAVVIVFQQLANWAWRSTKESIDKRKDAMKECEGDLPPAS